MSVVLPARSPLTAADEDIHEIGEEPMWREAFTFDLHDPATGITSVCYGGVHPNKGTGDLIYCLWKDGVMVDEFLEFNCTIPKDIGRERFGFSRAFFGTRDPFRVNEWYVNNNGRSIVDLEFHASNPPYDWRESGDRLSSTGSNHYEHMGRYRGTIEIHGKTYEINEGVGFMDHAWGWGKRAGIKGWLHISAFFDDDFVINSFQIRLGDDTELLYGYIYRGDENVILRRSHTDASYHRLGLHPETVSFDIEDMNGSTVKAHGECFTLFNNSHIERNKWGHHYWAYAKYECEGQTGYGMANFHWRGLENRSADWLIDVPPGCMPAAAK